MTFPPNPFPQVVPARGRALLGRLRAGCWSGKRPVAVRGGPVHDDPVPWAQARRADFLPVAPGETFGPPGGGWSQRWFTLRVPAAKAAERGRRALHWDCDGETTVWIDDRPWAGLDVAHGYCVLPDAACTLRLDCGTYQTAIWVETYRPVPAQGCVFRGAHLAVREPDWWQAAFDLEVLLDVLMQRLQRDGYPAQPLIGQKPPMEQISVLARRLLGFIESACNAFDRDGLPALQTVLLDAYAALPNGGQDGFADLCGHAHLDLVWLWPERITERKGVHTFATVLRLLEQYPEFRFTQSMPALYQAIERQAPRQADEIRLRIAEGRWEATGGMEVEADVTIPCGEALARSFLYGQQRLADWRGGAISRVLWVPDVFGYSNCLPQMMQQAGIEAFFTTKLSWSEITRFPYTSFRWRGPDGSEVLTHLCAVTYNGTTDLAEIDEAQERNLQAAQCDRTLLPTGYGDGAGGPTEAMCERARRFADLADVPRVGWTTAEAYFDQLASATDQLPVYEGELYLEYHRGTYTSQSDLKKASRTAERALLAHEAVRVLLGQPALASEHWRRLLFAQFHDALPGSSIADVYEEMVPELQELSAREMTAAQSAWPTDGDAPVVVNTLPQERSLLVAVPAGVRPPAAVPVQRTGRGRAAQRLVRVQLPALAAVPLDEAIVEPAGAMSADPTRLQSDRVQARFDADGQLQELHIDGQRLALQQVGFWLYPDHPAKYDAWDIDRATLELGHRVAECLRLQVVEDGPLRVALVGDALVDGTSRMTVRYELVAGEACLRVRLDIDWQAEHRLLKFHCRTGYQGGQARFGAPFGSVSRAQKAGVTTDESRWEVPAQRWAAVVDDDRDGLALISEAKYGFSCRDGDLGLSLLRSPRSPDPTADRGRHAIAFALARHQEAAGPAGPSTAQLAESLYADALVIEAGRNRAALLRCDDWGSLVPAAVKPSEDGRGWILRLHETAGRRGCATLHCAPSLTAVERVDILERRYRSDTDPVVEDDRVQVAYGPYEIIGLRLCPA